jgi:CRP/FNR family transcriptional regulator, cyclic AMP receptor protein
MARLIRRARLATESARNMALIDVYGRMSQLLQQLADPPDAQGHRTITQRITHQEIASHLACSREMVSRLLRDLQAGGYVEVRERRLVLVRGLPLRW